MDQGGLIEAIRVAAPALPGLQGLFLTGSFGRGEADAVSDVDLLALADLDDHAALAAAWRTALDAIAPVAHWIERRQPVLLLNAVTDYWLRCDLLILHPMLIGGRAQDALKPLYDPADRHARLPATLPPARPDPVRIRAIVDEFLRVLGLLPVLAARDDWFSAAVGAEHLRKLFTDLLLEEVTAPDRGGMLHLKRLLARERLALLEDLPHPGPTRDAVIDAHRATARAFLAEARPLAARAGAAWPDRFETATRAHLIRTLALEV